MPTELHQRGADPASLTAALLADEDRRRAEATGRTAPRPTPQVRTHPAMSLRTALATGGRRTMAVLFLLNVVDEFDRVALYVLGPDIQESFGISDAMLGFLNGIGGVLVFAGAVPLGLLADRRPRVPLIAAASFVWAAFALLGGFARNAFQLTATRMVNGLGKGVTPSTAPC